MSTIGEWNDAAGELDAIVASFDEGEVSVDDLFAKLERATAIIESLEARLDGDARPASRSSRRAWPPSTNSDRRRTSDQLLSGRDFAAGDAVARADAQLLLRVR